MFKEPTDGIQVLLEQQLVHVNIKGLMPQVRDFLPNPSLYYVR